ncbi:diphthine synthase [Halocatena pleomorpha]|uniref:Diphthine synthase n=1 Tax=Halocatena pleomorpha TaxID=1785090 RepID=A0A3P3RER5_9EURY|nr:diphthine synthase [Halocatena pleomorpha]RRJ31992.1 diphthine synthase [Halocatena pleomorpha]
MLTFVGLGLYDEHSITVAGRDAISKADRVVAEFYTSQLTGTTLETLEAYHDVAIEVLDRVGVEQQPEPILDAAMTDHVVFLTAGDPMISTTHVDLRLRAAERDIDTRVIHGTTAQAAASSLTGLQNYRFGKATTLPFPSAHGGDAVPTSVLDTIETNREHELHTLVYLDIKAEREEFMRASTASELLYEQYEDVLAVAVCRAGSDDPVVVADQLSALASRAFGPPLHLLIVPGTLHHMEADALAELAGAPQDCLDSYSV